MITTHINLYREVATMVRHNEGLIEENRRVIRASEQGLAEDARRGIHPAAPAGKRIAILAGGQGRCAHDLTRLGRLGRLCLRWLNRPLTGPIR